MKILHYSLGFPPYRSGGLTKFCADLMSQQVKEDNEVALLWPGAMGLGHIKIRERRPEKNVLSFELINPLPVPFAEGIAAPKRYMNPADEDVFLRFLEQLQPDVIHIHTLMGLPAEFVSAANKHEIRKVFTTHDFFPICPKVTMYRDQAICPAESDCANCPRCNVGALPIWKIAMLQSPLYRSLKNASFTRAMRRRHIDHYNRAEQKKTVNSLQSYTTVPDDYRKLRKYYADMLSHMDCIHYNSTLTRAVYEAHMPLNVPGETVCITHADIRDNRKKKTFGEKIRLSYLGPPGGGKGFFLLRAALDKLWHVRQDFSLNVYFQPDEVPPYMSIHQRYDYSQLESIFEETDLLLAPSIWYETFGYTVLEALSFGTPVLVSGSVGARDLIPPGCGIVLEGITAEAMTKVLAELKISDLRNMNDNILQSFTPPTMQDMSRAIQERCYRK